MVNFRTEHPFCVLSHNFVLIIIVIQLSDLKIHLYR